LKARLDHSGGVCNWHWYFCRAPCQGVRDALPLGRPDVGAIASVGIQGRANVPAINSVGCPGLVKGRFLMDNDVDTWGGDGRAIEVVISVDLVPSQEFGVNARSSHEVECEESMREYRRHQRCRGKWEPVKLSPAMK
jgi:hypothetical protein